MPSKNPPKPYKTGLLALDPVEEPRPPYRGKAWRATLEPYRRRHGTRMRTADPEVVLWASRLESAQRALDLILGSHNLLLGQALALPDDLWAFNEEEIAHMPEHERPKTQAFHFGSGTVRRACALAARASHRRKHVYAIAKYRFSMSVYSSFAVDLQPSAVHLPTTRHPDDHVRFSHCIISAYSVLEELGLEVRASQRQPSMVGGKWNPTVLSDLQRRLRASRIDISVTETWTMRATPRKIERARSPQTRGKEAWAWGPIRDSEIELVDAIAYASWLRSKVASHKLSELAASLSPYDVANVQGLARRLLLETLGFWPIE